MRQLSFFVALVILSAATVSAQIPPELQPPRDIISVTAQGKFEAEPDTALIQFRISAQEPQLKAAYDRASRAAEQVRQVLRANGIQPKEAEIGFLRVSPVYDWTKAQHKLIAYVVDSEIQVKVRDFAKLGSLAQSFTDMDVTSNQAITYMLDDTDAAKLKALENAYAKARTRAQALAVASGRTLGAMVRANLTDEDQERPMVGMMRSAAAGNAPPTAEFTPAKLTILAHVTAEFLLK